MYEPLLPNTPPDLAERKTLRRSANFVGTMILMMFCANVLVSIVLIVLGSFGLLDLASDDLGLNNTAYLLVNMVLYLLFLPLPALFTAAAFKSRVHPFPAQKVGGGLLVCLFLAGMGLAVLSNLLSGFLMDFLTALGVPYPTFPDTMELTATSLVLNIVSTAVLPAFAEELIFRGYVQGALKPFGNGIAIVLSAFLFGIFHGNILQFPFAFFMGLVFGWLFVATDSIWPCILVHFGNNLMSVLLDWFAKAYPDTQTEQITVVFTVVAAIGVVALGALLLRDKGGFGHRDVLRPVHNGAAFFPVSKRVSMALFSPVMLVALIVLAIQLLSSMVMA